MLITNARSIICGLCLSILLLASSAIAATLDATTGHTPLDSGLRYLVDEQDALTATQALAATDQFATAPDGALNVGHTNAAYWISTSLQLASSATDSNTWFIEIGYSNLSRASLYVVRSDGRIETQRSGYDIPLALRPLPHHNFVFPVQLSPGEQVTLLFNVQRKGGAIQVPLHVWNRWNLMLNDVRSNYLYGAMFGIMYAMILYNLFLFITMRLRSQFFYIAYLCCTILSFHSLTGYGHLLLWPEWARYTGLVTVFASNIGIMLALAFLRSFVHTQRYAPRLDKALLWIIGIGPFVCLAQWGDLSTLLSAPTSVYASVASVAAGVMASICAMQGSRPAKFFLLGWICFLLGVIAFSLSLLGVLPVTRYTQHSMPVGAIIEVILLSLGLADRFNTERKERYTALAEKHDALVRLKETEHQLMFRALHSGTTGLPNRHLMRESLRQLIDLDNETEMRFSLLLVSFKNFHEFNKTLGHQNGDAILRELSLRMNHHVGQREFAHPIENREEHPQFISTVEGVIFGCIVKLADTLAATGFATQLQQTLEEPFLFQGMSLQMDVSVGISQYPRHGNTADQLLRSAQIALELAGNHPEQIMLYSQDEDPYSAKRLTLLSDLRNAIDSDQLELYLQPQLDLSGSRVTGAEVLIRWKHPQHGFIPPDQFIPLAERTGVIQPLTYWVFKKAFSHLQTLNALGHQLTLSVNISARNLQDPAFQDKVLIAARQHQISPEQVVMELTETAMMINESSGTSILHDLDRAGFGIAIDDFGTGYSSLAYLKRLPVQEIKIDRTFIKDMAQQQDDQIIVTTTLQMGHNLGLRVVAEGIEDEPTLDFLRNAGCDLAQGYFIAKPMPFNDFIEWLNRRPAVDQRQAVHHSH